MTLLSWQKDKSSREIAEEALVTPEDTQELLSKESFMRRELIIKKLLFGFGLLFVITVLVINSIVYVTALANAFVARWIIEIFEITIFIYLFVRLVQLAKVQNKAMYLKHERSLRYYFLGTILFLIVSFLSNFLPWLLRSDDKNLDVPWRLNIRGVYDVCHYFK